MSDSISGLTVNELILQAIATKGRNQADLSSDSALSTQLIQGCNLVQMDYCGRNDWKFLHSKGTIAITSGTNEYTVSNVEKFEVIYDKTNNRIIRPASNKELARIDPNEDWSGSPTIYAKWGDLGIILLPKPDANNTLNYRAKILPTHISLSSSHLTIPYKYQGTFLHGLKAWFYDIVDDQRADRERQLFEAGIVSDWEKDTLELDDDSYFYSYEDWLQDPITNSYEDYLGRYFG